MSYFALLHVIYDVRLVSSCVQISPVKNALMNFHSYAENKSGTFCLSHSVVAGA